VVFVVVILVVMVVEDGLRAELAFRCRMCEWCVGGGWWGEMGTGVGLP
jgi:hypothetical protein